MDEEMEMEEEIVHVYDVFEIDFDYEFDATRFFDFTRPESEAESRFSESWFSRAPDYPPSPFVAQLFPLNGLSSPNVDVSPKSKYNDRLSNDDGNASIDQHAEYCDQDEACREDSSQALLRKLYASNFLNSQNQAKCSHGGPRGLSFFNHLAHDNVRTKPKSLAKPYMRKTSTLMKPTASQLAKKNQQHQVCGSSRLQKNEGNSGTHSGMESQASKRQKLDGGHLRRIVDVKQPVNLTHKLPKKDAAVQGLNSQAKLRITIPREPDLATAHRAERIRLTSTKEMENPTTTYRFKARTLNRKTLEAPVLPFSKRTTQHLPDIKASHLKTIGRTNPSTSTNASASVCRNDKVLNMVHADSDIETGNKDGKGSDSVDIPRVAVRQVVHSFKARPLDRKILASRGDIGVFRNNKRDVTVPKEFMFQTSKRTQPNLPTELFSKLSLAGEPHSKNCAQVELPQNTTIPGFPAKESKENRWESCHLNKQNKIHLAKEKLDTHNGKERLTVANGRIGEVNPRSGISRPLGSRRQQ